MGLGPGFTSEAGVYEVHASSMRSSAAPLETAYGRTCTWAGVELRVKVRVRLRLRLRVRLRVRLRLRLRVRHVDLLRVE